MRTAFAGPGWAREPKRDRQKAAGPSPLIEQDIGSTGGSGPRGAMRRNPDSPVSAPRSETKTSLLIRQDQSAARSVSLMKPARECR
jgi:hypothetical protein